MLPESLPPVVSLPDFLWFYGESNILLREGFWRISNNPNDPVEYLQIDWTRDPENSAASVRYTVITPGGAENGTIVARTDLKFYSDKFIFVFFVHLFFGIVFTMHKKLSLGKSGFLVKMEPCKTPHLPRRIVQIVVHLLNKPEH